MPNQTEDDVIRKLRDRVAQGNLDAVDVLHRVTGGVPTEKGPDFDIRLSGTGQVTARLQAPTGLMQEASDSIPQADAKQVLLELAEVVRELIPRSEARFIPDSLVGQIVITIDGQQASFLFLIDDEQAKQQGATLSPRAKAVVDRLVQLHKRMFPV